MLKQGAFEIKSERGRQKMEQIFLTGVARTDGKTVEECLAKGVNPNAVTAEDRAALHIAAVKGDTYIGSLLLANPKTNVNIRTVIGLTPLMYACIYQRRKFVQELLTAGAKVNLVSDKQKTALHFACIQCNMGIVFDLVSRAADINTVDVFDNTPLSTSVIDYPTVSIARFLLRKGANATKTKKFPLLLECALTCCNEKRLKIMEILVSYDVDVNCLHPISGMNCLHYIGMTGYLPAAEFLLVSGVSLQQLDKSNRTPLDVAMQHENRKIIRLYREWTHRRRIYFSSTEDILQDIRYMFETHE